ncbi:hypothetical protein ONS95_013712 [Cadophora gregata]|uniref:uncharacterized protein n=1 Tax=Cadophora gregata TaxID=51156 RepID=UPI0026DD27A9|nr:uncharacterized protein ONS95_013712 [Cadophora gregata]KAK0114213.1 hypothetical protein ONS95_013712 [Cadophora gregata]
MAQQASQIYSSNFDRTSKENRWYYKDLGAHLPAVSRKLLEGYSQIPSEDVDSHVYKMRDILWDYAPYPCIGEFKFLTLNLPLHPKYPAMLQLLAPTASNPSPKFLDLGCCVGQELRALAHFGKVPSEDLYGSDINGSFLSTSYDLFKDKSRFKGTLVPADIFSQSIFDAGGPFENWEGNFTVIHAGLFLHLFNIQQQVEVCKTIIKLLSDQPGALFLGEMVGCLGGGERGGGKDFKFWKQGEERKQFLHDGESFKALWDEVAKMTSTEGMWKVEGKFKVREKEADGEGSKGCAFFVGEGIGWLTFSVERK